MHCTNGSFSCPCSQSAKGTPILTLLKDPYILVAAGELTMLPFGLGDRGLQDILDGSQNCPPRLSLLCQHGGGHAGAHTAHLDDADHVLP